MGSSRGFPTLFFNVMDTHILVICEGASECNYLVHLQRFLRELPPLAVCGMPLTLIGLPKNYDPSTLRRKGVGTGTFGKIVSTYNAEWRKNKSARFLIWVDDDLYVRDDKMCGTHYAQKTNEVPDFSFSVHNFEDFIALHFPDGQFEEWKGVLGSTGHFQRPLHGAEYATHFQRIWPKYKKGDLPLDFVTDSSLRNMIRHLQSLPPMAEGGISRTRTFAQDLADILKQAYPEIFT